LTWVPVANGKVSASWTANTVNKLGGYAVYKTADWEDAAIGYKNGSSDLYETAAPEPVLFLPAAGFRSNTNGVIAYSGNYGRYWSSTLYPSQGYYLLFYSDNVMDSHNNRAMGHSIRCVKE
jgi:hypothetical protein